MLRRVAALPAIGASLLLACGDREPERRPAPPPPAEASRGPSVAEQTGWPAGIGRALVMRLPSSAREYRLVFPELGDRRFADSALSLQPGEILSVTLLDRRGAAGDARVRVTDAESGSGSCVTWPSAELTAMTYARRRPATALWRVAVERDSVTPITLDSLAGMRTADSLRLAAAVNSAVAALPAGRDSTLRGIPFAIRRAYAFSAAGIPAVAAELVRTSGQEANPREERLFVIGEPVTRDPLRYRPVYSRRLSGRADSVAATELLAALVSRQSRRAVLVLGLEDAGGIRLALVERAGDGRWRLSWSSIAPLC